MYKEGKIEVFLHNDYSSDGKLEKLVFPTEKALVENLKHVKIVISFPRSDTHPEVAGELETLTQRYWEAMLSGCLMVGRAPQELIDFIGYNPVIDVDYLNPVRQLEDILNNIKEYQELVDKNYFTAKKKASWSYRIKDMKKILSEHGYEF